MRCPIPFLAVGLVLLGMFLNPRLVASENQGERVRNPHMGVCTHFGLQSYKWDLDRLLPFIDELGVGWVRDEVYWEQVEPEKGRLVVPAHLKRWTDAVAQKGIRIVLVFNGGHKAYEDRYDPEGYSRAAAFLARELKGKVQAIEVLNEPANFGYSKFYGGRWNGWEADKTVSPWVGRYVTLLNTAAKAIKAAVPEMKVIGLGSVAPVNFRQIQMGLAPEVDGIVDHPYSFRTVPELLPFAATEGILERDGMATADRRGSFSSQMSMYRELAAKHGRARELWLTEWGFPNHIEREAKQYAGYTSEAQAKYALRRFAQTLGLGIEVSIWYDLWEDGNNPYEAEHRFGMIARNYEPKPVYQAVQRLARLMTPYSKRSDAEVNVFVNNSRTDRWPIEWDGGRLESSGAVMTYSFENEGGDLLVLAWSTERAGGDLQPRVVDLEFRAGEVSKQVTSVDLWSGEETLWAASGEGERLMIKTIPLPAHPLAFIIRRSR